MQMFLSIIEPKIRTSYVYFIVYSSKYLNTKQAETLSYGMRTAQINVQTIRLIESYQWELFVLSLFK